MKKIEFNGQEILDIDAVEQAMSNLDTLEETVGTMSTTLENLGTTVEQTSTDVETLSGDVEQVSTDLTTLSGTVTSQGTLLNTKVKSTDISEIKVVTDYPAVEEPGILYIKVSNE